MRLLIALAGIAVVATGCGGSNASSEPPPASTSAPNAGASAPASGTNDLRSAAQTYSNAYLTGRGAQAFDLLSKRCKASMGKAEFLATVHAAKQEFGIALPFKSFSAEINGMQARVTYTFAVSSINQDHEPWVNEGGSWHEDDC